MGTKKRKKTSSDKSKKISEVDKKRVKDNSSKAKEKSSSKDKATLDTKKAKKEYSKYENPKSKELNSKPVEVGSVVTGKLSFYQKLPAGAVDHTRESIVMVKCDDGSLCVVYIHGLYDRDGNSRKAKADKGIWLEIVKNGQHVYVDLDLRTVDSLGRPLKQSSELKNTGVIIDKVTMEQIKKHIFETSKRSHSIRKIVSENKKKANM